MKFPNILPIAVISLIVWLFFYFVQMPLDAKATVAVVVICAIGVFAFNWIKKRMKKEGKNEQKN